jgi:hypothetical protein
MLLSTHIDINKILVSFKDTICGHQGAFEKNHVFEFKSQGRLLAADGKGVEIW